MRRLLALAAVLIMVLPLISVAEESQGPLGWAVSGGGFDDEILAGHVVLDDGQIVVAGSFTSAVLFDDIGLGAVGMSGDVDMYVAVMNATGNWTSAFNFGSIGADGIDAIALHTSGDLILVGHFCLGTAGEACEVNMSSFTLNKSQDNQEGDAFVGRFALSGNALTPIWVRTISNQDDLSGFDVEVGPNGGISVGIFHKGFLSVEGEFFPGAEGTSIALLHYDENGQLLWTNGITSQEGIEAYIILARYHIRQLYHYS